MAREEAIARFQQQEQVRAPRVPLLTMHLVTIEQVRRSHILEGDAYLFRKYN